MYSEKKKIYIYTVGLAMATGTGFAVGASPNYLFFFKS